MPEKQERPSRPPLGLPAPSFSAPSRFEECWVETIDISTTKYEKLPRGTLYKDVVGHDSSSPQAKDIIKNHPNAFLLREIVSPQSWPFAFRYWADEQVLTTKTLGTASLTPEKYRRLVRTVETDELVGADYKFPNGLSGDQTQIKLQQQTVEEARLQIISEVIAIGGDPLTGGESSEYGPLKIYETVVPEGTLIDTGFLVVKSTVTPFGNGKAAKITVKSTQGDFVVSVGVDNGGSGYTSAPTVVFASGSAAATARIAGGKVVGIDVTTRGSGYTTAPGVSFTGGGGTGAAATAYLGIVVLQEQDYDQRLDVVTPTELYLAPLNTIVGTPRVEVKAIDPYRAEVRTIGVNTDVIDNFVIAYISTINVDMPDKLVSVAGLIEKTTGDGADSQTGSASLSGNGSVSLDLPASSQANCSIVPEAVPFVKQFWGNNIKCQHCHFFLLNGSTDTQVLVRLIKNLAAKTQIGRSSTVTITIASPGVVSWTNHGLQNGETVMFETTGALPTGLLPDTLYYIVNRATSTFQVSLTLGGAAINTTGSQSGVHTAYRGVSDCPNFNPDLVSIVQIGGSASVQAKAVSKGSSSMGDTGSSSAAGGGVGYSQDLRIILKSMRVSPTIHPAINLAGTVTDSETISAAADADAGGLGPFESQTTGPITVDAKVRYMASDGSLSTTIPATTGATDWPTVGLFVYKTDPSLYRYGYVQYHMVIVDASKFPNV
jgi:hypothetical protein